jgi:putative aldouronate transport system permease protein
MTVRALPSSLISAAKVKPKQLWRTLWRYRGLYLLMLPSLIYFAIFKYGPLWNAQIAFKDFKPLLGVWGSPWVGFKHFETFINSFCFGALLENTIIFSLAKLLLRRQVGALFFILPPF